MGWGLCYAGDGCGASADSPFEEALGDRRGPRWTGLGQQRVLNQTHPATDLQPSQANLAFVGAAALKPPDRN